MRILFGIAIVLLLITNAYAMSSLHVPAVDAEGTGVLSSITVTATAGKGDVFVSVEPLTGTDTQHSEKTAVQVASEYANVNPKKYDVLLKIESTAEIVDGPSAGAAMALLAYAEFSGKKPRKDLTITGSIDRYGRIGKVGGIFEKAKAVAESTTQEYNVFIVPGGQRIQSGVDVAQYAKEKWNMQVIEADTIKEVLEYAFNTTEGEEIEIVERAVPPLNLIDFKASDNVQPFKEIAQRELEGAKEKLEKSHASEEVKASMQEAMELAEKLIDNNYYYSSANTAFLIAITLDELENVNGSKQELREKLRELKASAENINFSMQTEGNLEWAVGAKLRYHWASRKLSEAEDKIAIGNYVSAAGDLALAGSWLRATQRMNSVANQLAVGREMKDIYYRDFAADMIDQAKQLRQEGVLDNEANDHLISAVRAFENADYLTAAFDATFATSYAAAFDIIEGLTFGEVIEEYCGEKNIELSCKVFRNRKFTSVWEELYYAHSIYNFLESNRTGDSISLINGVKLIELGSGFAELREEVLALLDNPPLQSSVPAGTITPSDNVRVEVVAIPQDYTRNLIVYSIIGLVLILTIYAIIVRRPKVEYSPEEKRTKVERAEEMLLQGKISERSFEYFKGKYGGKETRKQLKRKKGKR